MKNTNTCPKCSSKEIFKVPGRIREGGGNYISAGFLNYVRVDRYVCEACGYSEEWIASDVDLKALAYKFKEVN